MKDTLALTDASYTLAQDIRYAQRSSLFLKRDAKERWIYGIGVEINPVKINGTGQYTIFKWCSPFNNYDANGDARMTSELPAYNPSFHLKENILGKLNANIVTNYDTTNEYCAQVTGTGTEVLSPIKGYSLTTIGNGINVEFLDGSNNVIPTVSGAYPSFILFESVTGRAFFYDAGGNLLNYYESSSGLHITSPVLDVKIKLSTASGQSRIIVVKAVSGAIKII
jgi:hypothetical protein